MLSLQVPDIIDADDVIACIAYGFIAGSVRLAQYINVPIVLLCHRLLRNAIFFKKINRLATFSQKY